MVVANIGGLEWLRIGGHVLILLCHVSMGSDVQSQGEGWN